MAAIAVVKSAFAHDMSNLTTEASDANSDDQFWTRVRSQFLLPKDLGYMNTGRLGPTPKPVLDALEEYWRLMAVSPSENTEILESRIETVRRKAAEFIGASPDEIAITRNATEGLAVVIKGLDLKRGDEIVYSFHEHRSNIEPWRLQAMRYGVVLKEVEFGIPPQSPEEILNRFSDTIGPRTRAITFAHCTTYTGCLLPIKELADLAKTKGVLCLVDGAHPLGMIRLNLRELGVDAFATTCHKWLCSPAGAGLLFVREGLIDRIWPNIVAHGWDTVKGARKYDRFSRRPWPQVVALEDALDFQLTLGRDRIEKRVRDLATYLRRGLVENPSVKLFTSDDPRMGVGLTTLGLNGRSGDEIRDHLLKRHSIWVPRLRAPAGADRSDIDGIRVSTHYFNNKGEIDRLLEGLREFAGRQ